MVSELWHVFAVFGFALGLTGAILPGPMLAATVMHARRWGWRSGVLVSMGHGLLELVLVVAILFGAGAALKHPAIARSISVAGGVFLVTLGTIATVRPPAPPATEARPDEAGGGILQEGWWRPFLAGMWTSATQPYWYIWWAFAGVTLVGYSSGRAGALGAGTFYVGHVLADVVWFTFVAAAVGAGRRIFSDNVFRRLFIACGAALLGFGLVFVAAGAFFPEALEYKEKPEPLAAMTSRAPTPVATSATGPARASRTEPPGDAMP